MVHGALSLALSSVRATETHVERVLSLQFRDQSLKRSLVHLHFPTWPELCVCCPWAGGRAGGSGTGIIGVAAELGLTGPARTHRGLPDSPGNLLRFIQEVHAHCLHQRPLHTPVVVHCRYGSTGSGRVPHSASALGPAYTPFLPQLGSGPHGSLCAALRRCAGGGGWERDP